MPSPDTSPQIEHFALSPERENMTREERIKHDTARQLALGPIGDLAVTGVRFRRDLITREGLNDYIPMSASIAESTNPWAVWDVQVLDPHGVFASRQEEAELVREYRAELTSDPVVAARIAQEEEQIALGRQRQEDIWAMEIAARDRKLAAERDQKVAEELGTLNADQPTDVFVSTSHDEQRAA